MKNTTQLVRTFFAGIILAATVSSVIPNGAQAAVTDPITFSRLQQQKRSLLDREYSLMRSKDEILRQMDDLKKTNSAEADRLLNDLSQSLKSTCSDLDRTRMDIRDVSLRMM